MYATTWKAAALVTLALAGMALAAGTAAAQGVTVALTPDTVTVAPGDEFDVDMTVTQAGSPFNGYDAFIGWDSAMLTQLSSDEGSLMTGACGNTFYILHAGAAADTITDVLLCGGVDLTGPGQIYHLHFQASMTPGTTQIDFLPGLQFYDAGLYVNPVTSTGATVIITTPVDAGPPGVPHSLQLAIAPNPGRGGSRFTIGTDKLGPQRLRVLDARGRIVRQLEDLVATPGMRSVSWDGRDSQGRPLAPGVYYVNLQGVGRSVTKPMTLLW